MKTWIKNWLGITADKRDLEKDLLAIMDKQMDQNDQLHEIRNCILDLAHKVYENSILDLSNKIYEKEIRENDNSNHTHRVLQEHTDSNDASTKSSPSSSRYS